MTAYGFVGQRAETAAEAPCAVEQTIASASTPMMRAERELGQLACISSLLPLGNSVA
jgi:hypothetical protein